MVFGLRPAPVVERVIPFVLVPDESELVSGICLQVFGVTHDPFIVYTSNMFAILSLRALYSFVATVLSELRYLDKVRKGLAFLAWGVWASQGVGHRM